MKLCYWTAYWKMLAECGCVSVFWIWVHLNIWNRYKLVCVWNHPHRVAGVMFWKVELEFIIPNNHLKVGHITHSCSFFPSCPHEDKYRRIHTLCATVFFLQIRTCMVYTCSVAIRILLNPNLDWLGFFNFLHTTLKLFWI